MIYLHFKSIQKGGEKMKGLVAWGEFCLKSVHLLHSMGVEARSIGATPTSCFITISGQLNSQQKAEIEGFANAKRASIEVKNGAILFSSTDPA